jgi:hypothetical protein
LAVNRGGCWTGNPGRFWQARPRGRWFAMADTHSLTPNCTSTSIPTYPVSAAWPAVRAHGHQPRPRAQPRRRQPRPLSHQNPDKEHGREAHIHDHDHEQSAQSPADADRSCRRPGTGAAQFAQVRAALECLDPRGRRRLTLDCCEIEPPTSAVNYPRRGRALGAAPRPHHRRVRGGRVVAQASSCSGGSGLLIAAPWTRYQARRTTQSDYGRYLGSVRMIVLFVPHAAG